MNYYFKLRNTAKPKPPKKESPQPAEQRPRYRPVMSQGVPYCANPACPNEIVGKKRGTAFCSKRCKNAITNPERKPRQLLNELKERAPELTNPEIHLFDQTPFIKPPKILNPNELRKQQE